MSPTENGPARSFRACTGSAGAERVLVPVANLNGRRRLGFRIPAHSGERLFSKAAVHSDLRSSGRSHDILITTRDDVEGDFETQSLSSRVAQHRHSSGIAAKTRQRPRCEQ